MARNTAAAKTTSNATDDLSLTGVDEITSTVQTGGIPAAPNVGLPGQPSIPNRLKTNLTQEYTNAGGYIAYVNYAHALPRAIDDLTDDLGDDLYDRMLLDPQVSSMIVDLKAAVLEDGMIFQPAVSKEEDPQYKPAQKMADWVTAVFKQIKPSLPVVLWDMCSAFAKGNRVAELVWKVGPDPVTKRPALLLSAIKPKPRESTSFVVDSYNNLLGLLALEVGRAWPVQTNLYVTDIATIPNMLPREKFAVLTFRPENNDPSGTTPLRQAYDPWWLARQSRAEYLAFVARSAAPSVVGVTPEDAEPATEDAAGNPLEPSLIVTPEQSMVQQLATLRNGTALAFPFGSDVKPLNVVGDGMVFERFEDRQDRRIAKAITGQTLSTEEGKHQTRASSGTHQDIFDTLVRQIRHDVEEMVKEQIIRLLVLFNFGEEALSLCPVPMLGRTEQHDFSSMAGGVASLQSSGYLGDSQKPGIDEMLGLPVRDPIADAQAAAQALATAQAMATADPNNPASKAAARTTGKEMAGGEVASDQAKGSSRGKAKPDKPQANPGAQSGADEETQKGAA